MTLVLDATSMGASANSYGTLVEAQGVLDGLPVDEISAWTGASANQQEQAMVKACYRLERLMALGGKTTYTQALNWPRAGVRDPRGGLGSSAYYGLTNATGPLLDSQVVPQMLKRAQAFLALNYLKTGPEDPADTSGFAGFSSVSLGPLSFAKPTSPLADDDLPAQVMRELTGLLAAGGGTFRLARS